MLLAGFDTSASCKSGVAGDDFVTGQDLLPVMWHEPTRTRANRSGGNVIDLIHFFQFIHRLEPYATGEGAERNWG